MLERIEAMLIGQYRPEDRLMLEARAVRTGSTGEPILALNDVVLQKGRTGRMQDFVTHVDGDYVNTHEGDGLIVCTATGSTAYALSCGGPIVQPDVNALMIVPICPHTLSDRPLVLKASSIVEIRVEGLQGGAAGVACDGEEVAELGEGDTLRIRAARCSVRLLHPVEHSYYEVLRSKLNWGRATRAGRKAAHD
jgi:NAD+ kinase